MTFKVWSVSLIFLTNVGPSISGIITSLINKSIFSSTSSNSFKAETPLSASYTLYPLFLSAIAVPDGSGNETLQTVTGRAIRVSTIPSLSRTIRNGDVIKESDIKWLTVPAAQVGNNMIRNKFDEYNSAYTNCRSPYFLWWSWTAYRFSATSIRQPVI